MADDRSGFIRELLTGQIRLPGVDFAGATGVAWGRLAAGIVGAAALAVWRGGIGVIESVFDGITGLIFGLGAFLTGIPFGSAPASGSLREAVESGSPGLIPTVIGVGEATIAAASDVAIGRFGPLAFPFAVAIVLAVLFVLQLGVSEALGGGD